MHCRITGGTISPLLYFLILQTSPTKSPITHVHARLKLKDTGQKTTHNASTYLGQTAPPAAQKFVTEILGGGGGTKIRKLGKQSLPFCFQKFFTSKML